jgi:pilus assembly protein CpaB
VIGVLALLFGGSAAVGVGLLYKQEPIKEVVPTTGVLVASRDIPRGSVLAPELVRTEQFPRDLAPAGALTHVEDAVGRVVFHSLVRDEPILERKLSAKNSKGGLAGLVPKGMRAFTIQTPHVAGQVAGFILPGNKVDVLLTMNGQGGPNDGTGGAVTTTLLQNVEILAVDQRLDAPNDSKMDPRNLQSVTLLVTPDQAAKLDLGQNKGTLHLTLRNPDDENAAKALPATLTDLQFRQEKPWSQQTREVIDALTRLTEAAQVKAAKQVPPVPEPSGPPPIIEIRTLRGTHAGVVHVEAVTPTTARR